METRPIPKNSLHVSLNDGWGPQKFWVGVLTAAHTHTPVQTGPTGSPRQCSLGALRRGLGWYGQHNGVQNVADHLKSRHTFPKWMGDAFYSGDGPYQPFLTILLVQQRHFWAKLRCSGRPLWDGEW